MAAGRPVDLSVDDQRELVTRVSSAWKDMRRGAAMAVLRDHLFGVGDNALEPGQFDTLDLLVQRDEWRMSDLAEALRVDPSTATRAVQRLLRTQLAERRSSSADGRVVLVSATEAGRARHASINARRFEALAAIVGAFEPDEREELASFLERFVASLDGFVASLGQP